MPDLEGEKSAAAEAAVEEVRDGMLIGLGTGSTAAYAVQAVGRSVAMGLRVNCVATSAATETLARSVGLTITPFDDISRVDLTIDGADEVDPSLRAIKGGGGALLREKVVAAATDRVIVIVDSSKPVEQLGRFKLPVEVLPFAGAFVLRALTEMGVTPTRRVSADGTLFRTDQGNIIVDAAFQVISEPFLLATRLANVPGIVEHGLFLHEIHSVFIGRCDGVEIIHRPSKGVPASD
jgi:ribose 5-phosphate isomerase A